MQKSPTSRIISLALMSVCGLLFSAGIALANVSNIQLKHFSVEKGLSQSTVTDIVEDNQGFMWFATTDGLNRFDGYDFVHYRNNSQNPNSLAANFARKLFVDSQGTLWVGTVKGLSKYQAESDNFQTFDSTNSLMDGEEISEISEFPQGRLMFSTQSSVYTLDLETMAISLLETKTSPTPKFTITLFAEEQRTWLGSYGEGIYMLDNETQQLHRLNSFNPWQIKLDANYLFDLEKYAGLYWLGTEQGVFAIDDNGTLVHHFHSASDTPIAGDEVRGIEVAEDGKLWLGTPGGISILDTETLEVFSVDANNRIPAGLQDIFILDLYKDSNDAIWIGTFTKGAHQYHKSFAEIKSYQNIFNNGSASSSVVWALEESRTGKIWLASQSDGISEFSPRLGRFEHYLQGFEHFIFDLAIDSQDRIWLGTSGGLYVYEKDGADLVLVKLLFPGQFISELKRLGAKMWVDQADGRLVSVDDAFNIDTIELSTPSFATVFPLLTDSQNRLWLTTDLGLAVYNLNTAQLNQIVIQSQEEYPRVTSVHETDAYIWVVTVEDGIIGLNKNTFRIEKRYDSSVAGENAHFTDAQLYNNVMWLSHAQSVSAVSLETGKRLVNVSGQRTNYNEVAQGASLITSNGKILFGGSKGVQVFDPERLLESTTSQISPPTITQLDIFNQPVSVNEEGSPLIQAIQLTENLDLPNSASPFSLKFAEVNPLNPSNIEYRYRLNGLSKEWLNTNAQSRTATFTNLIFGSYRFEVQSRVDEGPWSESKTLTINVKPPIWLHRNAIIIYGFMLFMLATYWFKQYKQKRANQLAIRESEERLKLTLWSSGDELWDWDIYRGQVFRANTWGTLDFPQDDIRANSSYQANIHQNDIVRVQQALREHMENDTDFFQVTYRARTYKGEWIWLLDRGKVVRRDANNQPLRMTGTLKNINHLKLAEEQLKLYQRSIETISDGVFITDENFRLISVNQAYIDCTGETREQAMASYLRFNQYPEAFTEEVKKSVLQKGNWFGEIESRRTNGEKYEMELNLDAIFGEDGKVSHYVGVFSDITSRKSTEKELLKLANTDPLTEMPNRSFFQASHNNLVRKDVPHSLICLDMDNFKKINDSLGHQTGDILIKQIGKRLQKIAGTSCTCYRLGGDEFSILIDNTKDVHHITHFAQRILDDLSRPFLINKQEFVLGASVGIAFYPEDGHTPQELLKNADTAMYFAKNAGGNKYQFFSGEMNQNAVRQLQIENLIRYGLKEDHFSVYYQPKVDIASGKLVSMEALVRFEHPEKGIVSPSQFIPLAEQTGQIIEIGEQVMRKACEDTKRWVSEGLFTGRVAINISARQFELPDLDDRIEKQLKDIGLSPLHLECEITEGTLMQNPDQALRMMERLREKGIHLALDDFGTGYSSLAYLKQFPLNTLKIDKAFIDDIATSNVDKHMTAAIINIAHNLGLKVVAEGVEQEKQLDILRRYECEMLQGYLYSKPLSSARFERLLRENQQLSNIMQPTSI